MFGQRMTPLLFCISIALLIKSSKSYRGIPFRRLRCPRGSHKAQVNNPRINDILGCGIQGCDNRYSNKYRNIRSCKLGCDTGICKYI